MQGGGAFAQISRGGSGDGAQSAGDRHSCDGTPCVRERVSEKGAEMGAETGEETVREIADMENDPTELTIREEECRAVRDALRTLSPDLRDAVNLVYFSDFSQAEAAKYLEISDSALRNRLFQAKKKLRVILAEVWYGKDGE